MSFLLTLLLLVILFASVALTFHEGIWTNAIRLINVVTAALVATNFFEPVASWLDSMVPSLSYFNDFLALWLLFLGCVAVFREITDRVSKVKVRFLQIAEQVGGGILSVWAGYVLVCFTLMTLHTAPLSRNFLFGGFQPEKRMFFLLAPDRDWLAFTHKMLTGTFYRSDKNVFDPGADFMPKYATRRATLEDQVAKKDTLLAP